MELHPSSKTFTDDNKNVLRRCGLIDKKLILVQKQETSHQVKWKQVKMAMLEKDEEYYSAHYHVEDMPFPLYTVFFARKYCAYVDLPTEINTSGWNEEGVTLQKGIALHYGFSKRGTDTDAIFFVVHPTDWGPFQKRFRDALGKSSAEFIDLVNNIKWAGTTITTTGAGTFLLWATGAAAAVAGGPVGLSIALGGCLGGLIAADLASRLTGDYLRYIG